MDHGPRSAGRGFCALGRGPWPAGREARGVFRSAAGFLFFDFFPDLVVAGVGGPADLFCFICCRIAGAVLYCRLNLERIER